MQIVHHEVTYLHHVMVQLIISSQNWVVYELSSRNIEQLLEEPSETREIYIVLLEKLVTDSCLAQFHNEVIDCLDTIFNLPCVKPFYLRRLHLFPVWLPKPGTKLIVLFF